MPIAARAKPSLRCVVLAAAGLAAAGLSGCDASSGGADPSDGDTRQVTVVGSGEVQGMPDTVTVNASVEFVAPDASSAMNQTSERQQAVIDALVDAGVDREGISTTQLRLQPQFGSDNTTITGYRASNSIDVTISGLELASQALALIVSTGGDAARINSVSSSIEDDSQLVRDARGRAFDDAKDRAEQYAQLSGLTLGEVISISEGAGGSTPVPLPTPRSGELAAVPLEPGQQTVGFQVTVIWELS